jgi:hypothetical protein
MKKTWKHGKNCNTNKNKKNEESLRKQQTEIIARGEKTKLRGAIPVAWRAGTTTLFLLGSFPPPPIDVLKFFLNLFFQYFIQNCADGPKTKLKWFSSK